MSKVCGKAANKHAAMPQATTLDYPGDYQQSTAAAEAESGHPAAASAATPTKPKTLPPALEALILALPTAHQDDALKAVLGEEATEEVKASCLHKFARKLAAGKAEDSAWLRMAIREDWGKAERSKTQQKQENQKKKDQERNRHAATQQAEEEARTLRKLEIQKRWLELQDADRELIQKSVLNGPFDLSDESQLTWACLTYLAKQLGYPDDYLC